LDPTVASQLNSSLEKLLSKKTDILPEKLSSIKMSNSKEYLMMTEGNSRLFIGKLTRKEYADIIYNDSILSSKDGFYSFSLSHLPKEKATQAIIDHEIGHIIHNSLGQKSNSLYSEWSKIFNKLDKEKIKTNISEYAMNREDDFFAEAYVLHKNGKSNVLKGLSKKVSTFFEKLNKEYGL
jgi:hypothetical protein